MSSGQYTANRARLSMLSPHAAALAVGANPLAVLGEFADVGAIYEKERGPP
jgi:hypothetical protein